MSQPATDHDTLTRYLRVRRAHGPSWSPDGAQIAYIADTSGLDQAWIVTLATGAARQLTDFPDRVGEVHWSPAGDQLLVTMDTDGDERDRLYLVAPHGGAPRALTTTTDAIHRFGAWSPDGQRIAYASNTRHPAYFDIWTMDLATGSRRCVLERDATLTARAWSPDGAALIVSRDNTNLDDDLFLVPLDPATGAATGAPRLLTPHDGEAAYTDPSFAPDSRTLYILTNVDREFAAPAALDLAALDLAAPAPDPASPDRPTLRVLADTPWDATSLAVAPNGRHLAWALNEEGRSRLVFHDLATGRDLPAPALPAGVAAGLAWSPDGAHLAFDFNGTRHNGNIWLATPGTTDLPPAIAPAAPASPDAEPPAPATRQLTHIPLGLDPAVLIEPELVRYPTFDGREIPAYYYRPTDTHRATAAGMPVIVFVHGGPESQFRPLHAAPAMPPLQYYLSRGFAVFAPNVRGSSGYGKTSIHLDDIHRRPESVADLKAGVEWLVRAGDADPERIGIMGRSYGGFMVLAAITSYPDLWAAAVDIVGIANFLTFFERTAPWRRHLRAVEYGDPERDADFLRAISPLFQADRIQTPLLVLHGANDPRVPVHEAEQIVAAVRARDLPAELFIFPDEGHFMLRESTQLRAYPAIGDWFERYMG